MLVYTFFQVNVVSSIVHGSVLVGYHCWWCFCLFFFRQAKSMGNKSLVCSWPKDRIHVGVWRVPGPCCWANSERSWLPCDHEDGWAVPGDWTSSLLWQFFFLGEAWPRPGEEGHIHVFYHPPESMWLAEGAECSGRQKDEGGWCALPSGWQHGCHFVEGQAACCCPVHTHQHQARDGGGWEKSTRRNEEGVHSQASAALQREHGGAWTWRINCIRIIQWGDHLSGGGGTSAGGCCRQPWSTPSSSGNTPTTCLQQPWRNSATLTIDSMFCEQCARAILPSVLVLAPKLSPRLVLLLLSLSLTPVNAIQAQRRTAISVRRQRSAPQKDMVWNLFGAALCARCTCVRDNALSNFTNSWHKV